MSKRKQRKFTPEFRVEVVALCPAGEGSIGQVSRDLFVTVTSVREWCVGPRSTSAVVDLATASGRGSAG